MTKIWKSAGVLGLGLLLLGAGGAGCETSERASVTEASFYQLCENTCEGKYECINGVCTLPCEIESHCDSTPMESTCRTRYGVGSCEAWCEGDVGYSEEEGCKHFGEEFVCWAATCHQEDWVGPPAVGPPGIDTGVSGGAWEVIIKDSEFSCTYHVDHDDTVCDLIEVYNPGEEDIGCLMPGRWELALEADKEALSSWLKSPPAGSELCQDLDCENLKACVIERLTLDSGGEPCMTEEGDSTYFRPGYCLLANYAPNINPTLREWCVEPDNDFGMGGAQLNSAGYPVLRVVGEGLPRKGGRLLYMCGTRYLE